MGLLGRLAKSAGDYARKGISNARSNYEREQNLSRAAQTRYDYQYKKEYAKERLDRVEKLAKAQAKADIEAQYGPPIPVTKKKQTTTGPLGDPYANAGFF